MRIGSRLDYARRLAVCLQAFRRDRKGAVAVEFAFIGLTSMILLLSILQFSLAFLAQMYIRDAVAEAATGRTAGTYAGNRAQVAQQICQRMIALENCAGNLRLETQPLSNYGPAAQPITGATFVAGPSGAAMMMRARAPVITFVPGLPTLHVSAAALYVRP
jgi:Flp pilus assembly protein TadG